MSLTNLIELSHSSVPSFTVLFPLTLQVLDNGTVTADCVTSHP